MKSKFSIEFTVDSNDMFQQIPKERLREVLETFEEFRKLLDTANIQYVYHHEIRKG